MLQIFTEAAQDLYVIGWLALDRDDLNNAIRSKLWSHFWLLNFRKLNEVGVATEDPRNFFQAVPCMEHQSYKERTELLEDASAHCCELSLMQIRLELKQYGRNRSKQIWDYTQRRRCL